MQTDYNTYEGLRAILEKETPILIAQIRALYRELDKKFHQAKGAEKLLIPVLFVLFSLGGAVFGMGEEALPFTMILCPLFVAVGIGF